MVLAYLIHEINESMHKQGWQVALLDLALDINWLMEKCIDITQTQTCSLSWLWTESVQFSS